MNERLMQAQDVFLDKINQICSKFGLNNVMAQLYALLYLNNETMSLDEMGERLNISKGSVSTNIRALERYGAVRRVWVRGSRKDYYKAEADIAKVIMDRVKSMAGHRVLELEEIINSSYQAINAITSSSKEEEESIELLKQKLNRLQDIQNKAQTLLRLFNAGILNKLLDIKSEQEYSEIGKGSI